MAMEPLSIAPSQGWYGNDGPWSPFLIGFGSPAQFVETLISTSVPQPYVVIPGGCIATDPSDCQKARGGFFYTNESSTWQNLGVYELVFEQNLDINVNADFGFDNITLGVSGSGAPNVGKQTIAGIIAKDYFLSLWGLRPSPTNFTNLDNPVPSLLQSLKTAGDIPSLSWGYTAGSYQIGQVNKYGLGSLTLGGYDTSRYQANNVSFTMASDTSRDLVVGLISIITSETSESLLPEPILTFLDSGVPHIWLPEEACSRFEAAFNLTYDSDLDLYLVNDTVHEALLAQNASIAFTVSNDVTVSASSTPVTINLPYSAFDLQLTSDYPGLNASANYFPLRRAANSTQYTLGRTFFQQAYVIADYERSIFSVHSATFPSGATQSLQAIYPVSTSSSSSTGLSTGAIAGIAVAGALLIIAALLTILCIRRRRRKSPQSQTQPMIMPEKPEMSEFSDKPGFAHKDSELHADASPVPELPEYFKPQSRELAGDEVAQELNSGIRPRYELAG